MAIIYNKLVRDKIPEIIREDGRECKVVRMGEEEYKKALLKKLMEEAQEACIAREPEQLIDELADIHTLLRAIRRAYGIDRDTIILRQAEKSAERGGYAKRLKLLWVKGIKETGNEKQG